MSDPVLPPGTPSPDPTAPKIPLTQDQINAIEAALPSWLKPWVPILLLLIPILLSGSWLAGKWSGSAAPSADATFIGAKLDTILAEMKTTPATAPQQPTKTTLYAVTKDTDPARYKDATGPVETYANGTQWSFKGTLISLPVVVTRENGIDVKVEALK